MVIKLTTKKLVIKNNGDVEVVPRSSSKEFNVSDIETQYIINNYKSFMNTIRSINDEKTNASFIVSIKENYLFLIRKDSENKFKLIVIYEIENENLKQRLKLIFNVESEDKGKVILVKEENRFQFVCNADVLQCLLAEANLQSQGKNCFLIWDKYFPQKKKTRKIYAPEEEIKSCLSNLDNLLQHYLGQTNNAFQVAYKKNKSVKDAAAMHKEHQYVFCIDIHKFFESCKKDLIRPKLHFLFREAYNGDILENLFLELITDNDGLFLGNPIAGSLANSVISNPVKYINNICKKAGISYSVYADDMIFSSDQPFAKQFVIDLYNKAFETYNLKDYFELNEEKTHGMVKDQRRVLGINLNVNNQMACKKKMFELIRVQIHKLSLNIDDERTNIEQLRGRIAWCLNIDETGKVVRYLDKFLSTVQKYKLVSNEKLAELGIV